MHDYEAAARWAEDEMELPPRSPHALSGPRAAQHGRALLTIAREALPAR